MEFALCTKPIKCEKFIPNDSDNNCEKLVKVDIITNCSQEYIR